MEQYLSPTTAHRRKRPRRMEDDPTEAPFDAAFDAIPEPVRFQEGIELQKVRHAVRRQRRSQPVTWWQKLRRRYIYPAAERGFLVICFFLPAIYEDRYRKLSYTVFEPETWPHMFTDPAARRRAQSAWKSYVNTLTDEWTSANVITALVLSAACAFLAIPNISHTTRYALMFTLLSSLASLMHATYHSHYFRSVAEDEHFGMLQLRTYLNCYRPIMGFILCQPILNLAYSLGSFTIGILAYLWPATTTAAWNPPLGAKLAFIGFFLIQIAVLGLAYKWHRSAFFTTNELLTGEVSLINITLRNEDQRAKDLVAKVYADVRIANAIHVLDPAQANGTDARAAAAPPAAVSFPAPALAGVLFPIPLPAVQWVPDSLPVLETAVPLGYESLSSEWENPSQQYVGRTYFKDRWRAGKVSGWHILRIGASGREFDVIFDFEVLCGDSANFAWLRIPNGHVFDSATLIPSGYKLLPVDDRTIAPTYIACAAYNRGRHLGEVTMGSRRADITYGGRQMTLAPFWVLLFKVA